MINCFCFYLNWQCAWVAMQPFSMMSSDHTISWIHWDQFQEHKDNSLPIIIQVEASEVRHMVMSAPLCLEEDAAPLLLFSVL